MEHENKMLKLEQENLGGEKIDNLTGEIEKGNSRINELETENKFVLFLYLNFFFIYKKINSVDRDLRIPIGWNDVVVLLIKNY